jgi:hypothetical protein
MLWLVGSAFAASLQIDLALPEADSVSITVPDVAVGTAVEIPVRAKHARYLVTAEVQAPEDGCDWQVAFMVRSRGRKVVQPTMRAGTNQEASFSSAGRSGSAGVKLG